MLNKDLWFLLANEKHVTSAHDEDIHVLSHGIASMQIISAEKSLAELNLVYPKMKM